MEENKNQEMEQPRELSYEEMKNVAAQLQQIGRASCRERV